MSCILQRVQLTVISATPLEQDSVMMASVTRVTAWLRTRRVRVSQ